MTREEKVDIRLRKHDIIFPEISGHEFVQSPYKKNNKTDHY